MSAHMKNLHINDQIELTMPHDPNTKFIIPHDAIQKFFTFLKPFQVNNDEESIPADEFFKDIYAKHGRVGAILRGYRARDGITQAILAKKLNIRQSHLSQMETGKRTIGKAMARKFAKFFNTDYRLFL